MSFPTHLLGILGRPDDGLYDEGVAGVRDAREGAVNEVSHPGKVEPDELPVHLPTPERGSARLLFHI